MATIGEMLVRLLVDNSNFNASMDEAAAKVTASNDAMAASMAKSMQSFRDFDNITKESVRSAEGLASAQAALQAVQQTGAFTSEELAAKQALVDAAMAKVGKETQAASGALSMFTRNSRTMYSTSALITDAMTGQFSRMRREVAALGNETGLMARAFGFLVSPVGLAVDAVAAVGAISIAADDHFAKFEQTVLRTGDIIGMSAGELQEMANNVGAMTGKTFTAVDAVNALGSSGRFTGDQLQIAAEAAVNFSTITGENVKNAARIIESLAEKPKTAIAEVNDQFHFLTQSQADLIEKLLATGQNAQAAAVAVKAFHDAMAERADEMEQHTTALGRDWDSLKNSIEGAAEKLAEFIEVSQGGGDTAEKLAVAQRQLAHDEEVAANSLLYRWGVMHSAADKYIEKEKQVVAELQKEKDAQDASAQAAAKKAQATAEQFDKATGHDKGQHGSRSVAADMRAEFEKEEADRHRTYDQELQDGLIYYGEILNSAKSTEAEKVAAWKETQTLQKQLDEQQLAASNRATHVRTEAERKVAEAARQADEQRLQMLHQERDATESDTQARIAADQRIAAFAAQAYGKMSSQYTAALHQMQADTAAFEAKQRQLIEQGAEGDEKIAEKRIAAARAKLQEEYDAHQITDAQLLQGELKLDDELLAAQLAYLRRKEQLDAGNVAAVAKDQQQITIAQYEADQRRAQDEDRALKQSEQRWKQYSQRIAGSVQNAMNSMLFQGQTLKNGLASIAESIAETFIEAVVQKPLAAFIAGEGEKLAAAVGFGAQKTATENAQRATNAAADVADKTAAAARAAGLAGAQGVASFAAAPWPIDIGAPAFGAAMMAEALAFGSMASAAGGWERVPADGMLTELHRDEMVLPKHVADPMRNMARNGGGGGNTFHFHAIDAGGMRDMLRRNMGMFAAMARYGQARGHF